MDKTQTYAVYCQSGRRSGIAVETMNQAGFNNLFNLANGIQDWRHKIFLSNVVMRIVVVGGVAGGMSAATRRRPDADAEIIVIERVVILYANRGPPYYVGGVIEQRVLLLQTRKFVCRFRLMYA